MRSTPLFVMTALALALGGCNRPNADTDHPKVDYTTSLLSRMSAADIDRVTTPPAPAQRGPIPPDANAADPATNASLAFPSGAAAPSAVPPAASDHSPDGTRLAVMAQDAAVKAPDTAAADEAKRKVYEDAARGATAAESGAKGGDDYQKAEGESPRAQARNGLISEPLTAESSSASVSAPAAAPSTTPPNTPPGSAPDKS